MELTPPTSTIEITRLPSGIRVVTEAVPAVRSVAVGFFVGVGARDEAPALAGASHFLEHLLFKGTGTRSAAAIAEAVDAVGGEMNAYTAAEHTAYHLRLPASELAMGLDLLSDVVWSPAFRPAEVEAERRVILEELLAEEDCPDDKVLSLLAESVFPDHPLGREVLGTKASVGAMGRDDIAAFHGRWYRPANVVVAAAGALAHDEVVDAVARRFPGSPGGEAPVRVAPSAPALTRAVLRRRTEQAHVAVGVRGLARGDDDRFALAVANAALGGGMSSRLFREIREERGLAYSVYSEHEPYDDAGMLAVYAGTSPRRVAEVLGLVHAELDRLAEGGLDARELEVATGYLRGATVLGLEDTASRMHRLGASLLGHGEVAEVDEVLERYRSVTLEDVARVVARVLGTGSRTVAVVGPVPKAFLEPSAA